MQNCRIHSEENVSIRGLAGQHIEKKVVDAYRGIFEPGPARGIPDEIDPEFGVTPPVDPEFGRDPPPVCIIGAGAAGLYAAMMLESVGTPYEILEASDRIGGRLYTHRFNGKAGHDAPIGDPARYDYVDIGAMRYPHIPFMTRVFDLFKRLEMDKDGLLIQYIMDAKNTFGLYNGVRHNSADPTPVGGDIYRVSVKEGGAVPDVYVHKGSSEVLAKVIGEFAEAFKTEPFEKAWAKLTAEDAFSTRGYMLGQKKLPETVVEWLETFESATGLYNDAFVESVMDAMDFGDASATRAAGSERMADYPWYCIDGGSDRLSDRMVQRLKYKPLTGRRVIKIYRTLSGAMDVTWQLQDGSTDHKLYPHVICTVPLGCLDAMDLDGCDLSYMQRVAIRALNYDTSTKIALKFDSRWWENPAIMKGRAIVGGVSSTDIPIRTCVYPSYGLNCGTAAPGVMLASYTWAQDAQRLGGLAQPKGSQADKELVELTLKNLSQLHGIPVTAFGKLVDHYAYNWHNDPNARGAFALFGPGQFGKLGQNSLFASVKVPAAYGKLHLAGEATSVHHAWVLGALNSAWRAVFNVFHGNLEKQKEVIEKWGVPDEEHLDSLRLLAELGKRHKF